MSETAIDIDDLPELDTPVAICGAIHQPEVGGGGCFGIIIAVAIYTYP